MAHSKCAHFMDVVCLNAPSMFGQKMQPYGSQYALGKVDVDKTYRKLTNGRTAPH